MEAMRILLFGNRVSIALDLKRDPFSHWMGMVWVGNFLIPLPVAVSVITLASIEKPPVATEP
jgi:hypothetical protein